MSINNAISTEQAILNEILARQEQGNQSDSEEQNHPTGIDGQKRQGAGSVSNAPAGEDKTALYSPLFRPLEKSAGPLNFIKNFSGKNVTKAQNRLDEIKAVPSNMQKRYEYTQEANKSLNNAKADRNRARLGGGLVLGAAGAGLGGYGAYKKSIEPGVDEPMNQSFINQEQKLAYNSIMSRYMEKTAAPIAFEDLFTRLEKTAGIGEIGQNIAQHGGDALAAMRAGGADALVSARNLGQDALSGARDFGNTALGKDYRAVKDLGDEQQLMDQALIGHARNDMLKAQALTGAGLAGAGGAGYALANAGGDDDEEQVAYTELMERLEKTAAPGAGLFNKAKNAVGSAKYKAQMGARDFSGANTKSTGQNMQRMWDDPKNHNLSVNEFQKKYDKLKGANQAAISRERKAKKNVAVGASGLAAGGAGVAGANALKNKDDNNEKQASEVLNGLYKEAASAIIDESIPQVRQHIDPMSKITFSR